jgi:hypothetical protein
MSMTPTRLLRALALILVPSLALAAPLTSTVTRLPVEPTVALAAASSGKTPLERYHAATTGPYTTGTPLILIIRIPVVNSPDVVAVTDAHRDGSKISVAIETRRFDGPLAANEVTTPLVEVVLGTMPKGTYTIDVAERVLHFTKYDAPQTATSPKPGLGASMTFTVQ